MNEKKPTAIEKATTDIEAALAECNVTALKQLPALRQAVVLATGVSQLRAALTDDVMKRVFMPLMGSPLGFVTDLDRGTKQDRSKRYGVEEVRDCLIEGMIRGLRPVNNEINIISRRCYAAKNGVARLLSEVEGLSNLETLTGVPHSSPHGALVPVTVRWLLHGTQQERVFDIIKRTDGTSTDRRIPVRVNDGMGADAILGKAVRKAHKAVLDQLTGSALTVQDGEVLDTEGVEIPADGPAPAPAPPEHDGRRMNLKDQKASAPQTEAAEKPQAEPRKGPPPVPDFSDADGDGRDV